MRAQETPPPRITDIALGDLALGAAGDLEPEADLEALVLGDLDLRGRALEGLALNGCALRRVDLSEAALRGVRMVEVVADEVTADVLHAVGSTWRQVRVEGSRIGYGELYTSRWSGVELRGCKIGYLNLRGAELTDVLLTECTVDELDLHQATATRVAFVDTRVATLDVTGATLHDVDLRGARLERIRGTASLRGATFGAHQLTDLALAVAAETGIRID